MQNRELKRELIENGKATFYRKTRGEFIKANGMELLDDIMYEEEFMKMIFDCTNEEVFECERIRVNARKQRKKIEDHISFLMQGNWYIGFLTLTFTDDCLKNTTHQTRKRYVTRLLNNFDDYIANIDFGDENGREHYHAIFSMTKYQGNVFKMDGHLRCDVLDKEWKNGFYKLESVRTEKADSQRLSRYITKLTMHSIKVKQSYVTVKKGSPYQRYKKLIEQHNRHARFANVVPQIDLDTKFDEEETWLMSGYATDFDA